MHLKVLNQQQIEVLPLVQKFKREFYLVGGTAIALNIGHRRSVDFDLFKKTPINPSKIVRTVNGFYCLFYKMQIESELKSYYHFKNTPPS